MKRDYYLEFTSRTVKERKTKNQDKHIEYCVSNSSQDKHEIISAMRTILDYLEN